MRIKGTNRAFFTEVDANTYKSGCEWIQNIQKRMRTVLDGSDKIVCRLTATVAVEKDFGWTNGETYLGETRGRGRMDQHHKAHGRAR
jgi:hypothetical protein